MSKAKKKSPGGARAGAGRPPKPKGEKLVRRSTQITKEQDARIKIRSAAKGESEAEIIRTAIQEYLDSFPD